MFHKKKWGATTKKKEKKRVGVGGWVCVCVCAHFYFICTKIVLQEKIIPRCTAPPPIFFFILIFISYALVVRGSSVV